MNEDILTLTDENGSEIEFEVMDVLEYEEEEYIVLYPVDAGDDEPVHILKVISENVDDGEEQYAGLDDDELIGTLYRLFCKRNGL